MMIMMIMMTATMTVGVLVTSLVIVMMRMVNIFLT